MTLKAKRCWHGPFRSPKLLILRSKFSFAVISTIHSDGRYDFDIKKLHLTYENSLKVHEWLVASVLS
jgi:hypothetical protein